MQLAVIPNDAPAACQISVTAPTTTPDNLLDGDALLAEAGAHMVSAYRKMEALALLPAPLVTTRSFALATWSLYLALVALDECSEETWGEGPSS